MGASHYSRCLSSKHFTELKLYLNLAVLPSDKPFYKNSVHTMCNIVLLQRITPLRSKFVPTLI